MNRYYQLIAWAMILLIIDIPIIAADSLGSIVNYKVTGRDNVPNTVRRNDVFNVEATVVSDYDTNITADQLWLGNAIKFDTCSPNLDGSLSCRLTYPKTGNRTFNTVEPFVINLHDDTHHPTNPTSSSQLDSKSGHVVVDTLPPKVQVTLNPLKSAGDVHLSFKAYDYSQSTSTYDLCAGIKKIDFFTTDSSISTSISYPDPNTCYVEGEFDINATDLLDGEYTLTTVVTDYFGYRQSINANFEIDRSAPDFADFHVTGSDGAEVMYLAHNFVAATVSVDVPADIDASSVYADLSLLNDKPNYKKLKGDCNENDDDTFTCKWNIEIAPTAYGSHSVKFWGKDNIDNYKEQTFTKLLQSDKEGPRLLSIRTGISIDGEYYLMRQNNTIEAYFTETGSGLDPDMVLLDLSAFGSSESIVADSCEQSGRCVWENLEFEVADGKYAISINPSTSDRLGNTLKEGALPQDAFMDTTPPQVTDIEVNVVKGALSRYEGYAVYGDSLEVTVRIKETGAITDAYADFSKFVKDAYIIQSDECRPEGDGVWTCKWLSDPIDIESAVTDNFKVTFEDALGNSAAYAAEFTVYAVDTEYTDHWTHSIDCSPSMIDKEIASLVEQRVYCHIKLSGGSNIVNMEMGPCRSSEMPNYLKKAELLNNDRSSRDFYLKLTLYQAQISNGSLDVTCPLVLLSQSGSTVSGVPEIEEVNVNIPYYNSPLGEYGENMQEKIDDAVEDATGTLWKIITLLNKIMFYAERICSLITTINNVANLFSTVGALFKDNAKLMATINPPGALTSDRIGTADMSVTEAINMKIKKGFIGGDDGIGGFVNKFCKFISCRIFYDELWGEKATKDNLGWQRTILKYANGVATGGGFGNAVGLGGKGVNAYTWDPDVKEEHGGVVPKTVLQGGKLNPKDSIVLSFLTLCIPGIIYHLDKYRQIKCMYADCLKSSTQTGVPAHACEDQKEYQTCKYIYGEIFQLLPFTGLFNYLIELVKNILYNPFSIIDMVIAYMCEVPVNSFGAGSVAKLCLLKEMAGIIADIWSDIANFKDSWKIKGDYCARLDKEKKDKDKDKDKDDDKKGGLFG